MKPFNHPALITFLLTLACQYAIRQATADEKQQLPPQLLVTRQDDSFRFLLTGTPPDERNLWIIQSSFDLDTWDDLAVIEDRTAAGTLMIELPAASPAGQQQPGRFFRARSFDGDGRILRDYLDARNTWRDSGINSYSMEVYWGVSWFFWDGTVTVRNNRVISAETNDTNFFEPPEPRTIDDWFDVLKRAIDRQAEHIAVTYDKVFGFPAEVYIDISTMIADEEQGWTISNFIPHR